MERWSLNHTPSWTSPPLAIANSYFDSRSKRTRSIRYRLVLVKCSDIDWLQEDIHARRELASIAEDGTNTWVPKQDLPFDEIILFGYAADKSSRMSACRLASSTHAVEDR